MEGDQRGQRKHTWTSIVKENLHASTSNGVDDLFKGQMMSTDVSFIIAFIRSKISIGNISKGRHNWIDFIFKKQKHPKTLMHCYLEVIKINTVNTAIKIFGADALGKIKHKTRL